jgi:hypothetical protein
MTTTPERARKRLRHSPAKRLLTRLELTARPARTEPVPLSPADYDTIVRALRLLNHYDRPVPGAVRFLADAYQGSGCVTVASRDARAGTFSIDVYGPAAVTLRGAIMERGHG